MRDRPSLEPFAWRADQCDHATVDQSPAPPDRKPSPVLLNYQPQAPRPVASLAQIVLASIGAVASAVVGILFVIGACAAIGYGSQRYPGWWVLGAILILSGIVSFWLAWDCILRIAGKTPKRSTPDDPRP